MTACQLKQIEVTPKASENSFRAILLPQTLRAMKSKNSETHAIEIHRKIAHAQLHTERIGEW